ncbi:uncharacterized protein L201_004406 [Kwoniella dendrophila CBS 6074]|uniref:Peptidyl-prolyl cis-trans isomerase n=1 Tax=Kwoniella dendrophila CBS 6074 TaxID=1295534 RepID=A0AAX4JVT1_9TREE
MSETGWMKIGYGDLDKYKSDLSQWEHNQKILHDHYQSYGLPSKLEELNQEQLDILKDLAQHQPYTLTSTDDDDEIRVTNIKPKSLIYEEILYIDLFTKECPLTCENFKHLLKGDYKGTSKIIPSKKLHYKSNKLHRLVKDFIIQGGDIIKNNGSSGESIYGKTFKDEKSGLKLNFKFGTIAMASGSSKNSNSSQFFICLIPPISEDEEDSIQVKEFKQKQLNKLNGKYVIFGQVTNLKSLELLKKLNNLENNKDEELLGHCWIDDCGMVEK